MSAMSVDHDDNFLVGPVHWGLFSWATIVGLRNEWKNNENCDLPT